VLSGGSVHAATLSKLVERLTYDQPVIETVFDIAAFERVFLHQYRMLMTPEALLTLLERRFDVPQPPSVTASADVQKFRLVKQLPIQMKVYNVCHYWTMHFYDEDIGPDPKLEQRFLRFAQRLAQVRGVQDRLTLLLREKRQQFDQRAPIERACTSLAALSRGAVGQAARLCTPTSWRASSRSTTACCIACAPAHGADRRGEARLPAAGPRARCAIRCLAPRRTRGSSCGSGRRRAWRASQR
jgi:hypothetical protein